MGELRILIADDHPLMRRGVRDLLAVREGWRIVGEATDGADAVRQAVGLKPDVAILDFSMPEMNGAEAAASIRRNAPATAVVVLTMHDCDEVIHEVLQSGARGLVLKSDADRTLLGAVEAVAENRRFYTERTEKLVLGAYLTEKAPAPTRRRGSEPGLTGREAEVMRLLADGLTNREAAQALRISIRTVESHRNNMSRKLGLGSIAELVRYAIRHGIVGQT
jgi:DNA-binding NarL/FixJ family response regulator